MYLNPLTIMLAIAIGIIPFIDIDELFKLCDKMNPEYSSINIRKLNSTYDFIIVGGGSAGAVVASRLSEIYNWSVLLIEAGGIENDITDVPNFATYIQFSELDWKYQTFPSSNYCLVKEGHCNWPRGKVLGGSSILNNMIYVRGNRLDYDNWAKMGNTGWSYEEVLPYFLKSEDNRIPYVKNSPYHNTGGYLTVQESPWKSPEGIAFLQAGKELGYKNYDINGENQTGFMLPQFTMRDGKRCSTAKAFLRPVKNRPNLHIALNAQVLKVLIDDKKQATGIQFLRDGLEHKVMVRKEIILSAGTINSPQLLMLSGIGPKQHLEKLGIPVISDLRVGDNLQDHVTFAGLFLASNENVSIKEKQLTTLSTFLNYVVHKNGPLTNGMNSIAFVNTKYADPSGNYPDIQYHVLSIDQSSFNKYIESGNQYKEIISNPLVKDKNICFILPTLLKPKSSGWVRLKSKNPMTHPNIDPNYFAHKQDMEVLIESIQIVMSLLNTSAIRRLDSHLFSKELPGCQTFLFNTYKYWDCVIRYYTSTVFHPAGTCKMGPRTDSTAVVDSRLRVYGVKGLRVVDASIMPIIVNGNLNAPVIMIGEKASDIIKEDWKELRKTYRKRPNL